MADDQNLEIKVTIDDAAAMGKLAAEAKAIEKVGAAARATYQGIGKSARDTAGQRISASRSAAEADSKALGQSRNALGQFVASGKKDLAGLTSSSNALSSSFNRIVAAGLGVNAITGAYRAMSGAMHAATEESKKQVDNLLALKNSIRDIASMTGSKAGSSDAEIQKFINIRKASGLDNAGAKGFVQGFAGSGEAKKGVNISPEEYEKAKPLLAKFAAANSAGDAGAAESFGNLGGMLLGYRKNQTAGGALKDITNFNEILKAGVGDNPTLIREAAEQAGSVLNSEGTGIVKDPNQLAALTSVASIQKNPGQAGAMIGAARRSLRDFTGEQADTLSGAGITGDDDLVTALNKIFSRLDEAKAGGLQGDQFLGQSGFRNQEDRDAIMAFYNGRDYMKKFMGMAANPMTEVQAQSQLDAQFRGDSSLQTNVAQAKLDEAKAHQAMQAQHVPALRLEAQERLEASGQGEGNAAAAAEDQKRGWVESGFGMMLPEGMTNKQLGRKIREEQVMNQILKERGINVPGRPTDATALGAMVNPGFVPWLTGGGADQAYADATNEADLARRVGGGPAPKPAAEPEDTAIAAKIVKALEAQTKAFVEAIRPVTPTLPPARLGGANGGARR